MTHPYFLSDVKHRGVVAFAFADHDLPAHRDGIHNLAHGLDCYMVRILSVTLTHCLRRSDAGSFDYPQKIEPELVLHLPFPHSLDSSGIICARLFVQNFLLELFFALESCSPQRANEIITILVAEPNPILTSALGSVRESGSPAK